MGAQGIPARGGSPTPPFTTKHEASGTGKAQSGPVRSPAPEGSDRPVEEKNSPAEIPLYDKIENIDEEYRLFLSCIRVVNGHQMVVVPEGGLDAKQVPRKKDGEEAASHATSGKNGCGFGKEKGKGKVAAIATGGPALKSPVGDSTTHPQKCKQEPHLKTLNTAWGKGNVEPKLPMETLNTVKRKRKSSDVQNAESRTASQRERGECIFIPLKIVKRKRYKNAVSGTDNRKTQLRRSSRLMLSPPTNDHK
ncbi:hypothetical protein VPH35_030432 [Triticum aestivum]